MSVQSQAFPFDSSVHTQCTRDTQVICIDIEFHSSATVLSLIITCHFKYVSRMSMEKAHKGKNLSNHDLCSLYFIPTSMHVDWRLYQHVGMHKTPQRVHVFIAIIMIDTTFQSIITHYSPLNVTYSITTTAFTTIMVSRHCSAYLPKFRHTLAPADVQYLRSRTEVANSHFLSLKSGEDIVDRIIGNSSRNRKKRLQQPPKISPS